MKKYFMVCVVFILFIFNGFAQNQIPAWSFQGWGGNPPRSDVSYFLAHREKIFSSLKNFTMSLENVPMGNINKPAIFIKVSDADYQTWSNYAETEAYQWNYYEINNYVVLSFEMSFKVPDQYTIGGAKPGERIYFRYYLDPQSSETEKLVNDWINLQGPYVVFFLGDSFSRMNYYYNEIPKPMKDIAKIALADARTALLKISNKGTFQNACSALSIEAPIKETYTLQNISKFRNGHYHYALGIFQ